MSIDDIYNTFLDNKNPAGVEGSQDADNEKGEKVQCVNQWANVIWLCMYDS